MRFVTWNCCKSLKGKEEALLTLNFDIAVIQECQQSDIENLQARGFKGDWCGIEASEKTQEIGVGIVCRENLSLKRVADPTHTFVVPYDITANLPFRVVAVWSLPLKTGYRAYVEQVQQPISTNEQWFTEMPTVIAGDFNSNARWDNQTGKGHAKLVDHLERLGLVSLYHHHHQKKQGIDETPTFYQHRAPEKPFHLDYIFASAPLSTSLQSLEIGHAEHWLRHSDHCPIVADFSL